MWRSISLSALSETLQRWAVQKALIRTDDNDFREIAMVHDQACGCFVYRQAEWQGDVERFAWAEFVGKRASWIRSVG